MILLNSDLHSIVDDSHHEPTFFVEVEMFKEANEKFAADASKI